MKKNLKAFSLLELSVVMVIIAILTIGITSSNRFIEKARRTRLLMSGSNSPVMAMDSLVLWLDLEDKHSVIGKGKISKWLDKSGNNNDVIQPDSTKCPTLEENVIGNMSALDFENANMYIETLSPQISGDLTFFLVIKTASTLTQEECVFDDSLYFDSFIRTRLLSQGGYTAPVSIQFKWGAGYEYIYAKESTTTNTSVIISATVDNNKKLLLYKNGAYADSIVLEITPTFQGVTIGDVYLRNGGIYDFKGHVAEVIMYDRKLLDPEREKIEDYLSFKYGIGIAH